MFKILQIKINILNIKLKEKGGDNRMDGPVDRSEVVRVPHLRHSRVAAVVFVILVGLFRYKDLTIRLQPLSITANLSKP